MLPTTDAVLEVGVSAEQLSNGEKKDYGVEAVRFSKEINLIIIFIVTQFHRCIQKMGSSAFLEHFYYPVLICFTGLVGLL